MEYYTIPDRSCRKQKPHWQAVLIVFVGTVFVLFGGYNAYAGRFQSLWVSGLPTAPIIAPWTTVHQQPSTYGARPQGRTVFGYETVRPTSTKDVDGSLFAQSAGLSVPQSQPSSSLLFKIPIFGPLLGFLASVFTLYSYANFKKRHQENLEIDAQFWARNGNVPLVARNVISGFSGLKGKALVAGKQFPTKPQVMAVIPKELTKKDTFKSMMYMLMSVTLTGLCVYAGTFIPYDWSHAWAWTLYGMVTGTVATGAWVVGHECGHNAFSENTFLQDTVGYIIHSLLLVPYFAWQRSHAVHHANTNHMEVGETHVPRLSTETDAKIYGFLGKILGPLWGPIHATVVLVAGWPIYLMRGASGGPAYGTTNHFWPFWPFNNGEKELFPGKFKLKVLLSDIGVLSVVAALVTWGKIYGAMYPILYYVLPYMFVNAWLVGYTWLQHTDVDIPHFDHNEYSWAKGAFHTVDRPYGPLLDFLHHGIGSTHVAHHVNSAIPHYNAWEATKCLKTAFPDIYLYDPTPIHQAVFRIAQNCIGVAKQPGPDGMYVWVKDVSAVQTAQPSEVQPVAPPRQLVAV